MVLINAKKQVQLKLHTGVLDVHTRAFWTTHGSVSLLFSSRVSLFSFRVSLCLLSVVCSSLSVSCLLSLNNSLNDNDNDHSSSWLPCTHGPVLPDRQSAWTLTQSLSGENARNTQETVVQVFLCKPRATLNGVGLYLCWRSEGCRLCVFVRAIYWYVM